MKCIYYSKYSHAADDRKIVDAKTHGCNWTGDAMDMPFRLYKAAECESDHENPVKMVEDLFDALDMPRVDDKSKPFKVFYNKEINVVPTKHYYGATNEVDGVYEIDGVYYVVFYDHIAKFYNWYSAVHKVAKFGRNASYYLRGIDFKKP